VSIILTATVVPAAGACAWSAGVGAIEAIRKIERNRGPEYDETLVRHMAFASTSDRIGGDLGERPIIHPPRANDEWRTCFILPWVRRAVNRPTRRIERELLDPANIPKSQVFSNFRSQLVIKGVGVEKVTSISRMSFREAC
jgi:hypothetical protein